MKLLIFLSLFFYQTLHANVLYPLPIHEFDFSTSAYNSSNPSKKRALASVIDRVKTFFNKPSAPDSESLNSQIEIIKEAQSNRHDLYLKDKLADGVRNTILNNVIESLEQGADPNHRLHLNLPHLLQLALRYRKVIQKLPLTEQHEKIVEALLKHGADPNLYAKDFPPLHLAVLLRSPKIVKLLIKHGAKVDFKFNNDVTPLLLVVDPFETEKNFKQYIGGLNKNEIEFRDEKNLKLDKEITQALLDAGANIHEKTLGGNTLLVNAAIGGHLEFASFLVIEKGANLEEAIETIKKDRNLLLKDIKVSKSLDTIRTFQLDRNNSVLEFLENLKIIQQNSKTPSNEIDLKTRKASCPGAFG